MSLGVCPQFTAIDSQLTVREHLDVYGRLKGLYRGPELNENVNIILDATALTPYADRLASKLSGGNQRKLSLAIALIGTSFPFCPVNRYTNTFNREPISYTDRRVFDWC